MTDQNDALHPIQLAADTLGRDILGALVDELKAAPDCWQKMNSIQQDDCINRLRKRTHEVVTSALELLLRGHYPSCEAELDSISVRKGIQVRLTIPRGSRNFHELADAVGTRVLVVIADPEDYEQRMDEVRAAADQGELFGGEESSDDPPGEGADYGAVVVDTLGEPILECLSLLESVGCIVSYATAQFWTPAEVRVATEWAQAYKSDSLKAPARPHWLPIPEVKDAPDHAADMDFAQAYPS